MMKPLVVCVILAAVPGGFLRAQEPDSQGAATFRGMVRLNRAPVSNEVLKVKLPRPVERRLSNGLKLVILESHRAPTISLTISIPSCTCAIPRDCPESPKPPRRS